MIKKKNRLLSLKEYKMKNFRLQTFLFLLFFCPLCSFYPFSGFYKSICRRFPNLNPKPKSLPSALDLFIILLSQHLHFICKRNLIVNIIEIDNLIPKSFQYASWQISQFPLYHSTWMIWQKPRSPPFTWNPCNLLDLKANITPYLRLLSQSAARAFFSQTPLMSF